MTGWNARCNVWGSFDVAYNSLRERYVCIKLSKKLQTGQNVSLCVSWSMQRYRVGELCSCSCSRSCGCPESDLHLRLIRRIRRSNLRSKAREFIRCLSQGLRITALRRVWGSGVRDALGLILCAHGAFDVIAVGLFETTQVTLANRLSNPSPLVGAATVM
mgnify:CR=1 FL=1